MSKVAGLAILCLACMGSDCWPTTSGDTSSDGGYVGLGSPSVEVTVDGVHVGPSPSVAGSYADLTTQQDDFGQVAGQNLSIHVVAANASCDLAFSRFGSGIQAFATGIYQLQAAAGDSTPSGTTSPVGPLTVVAGQLTLQCSGDDCGSGLLSITALDSAHIEGFVSATMADPTDGQQSATVCSFYVPWRTYQP